MTGAYSLPTATFALTTSGLVAKALRCRSHHQPAGWECTACKSPLCPECAGLQRRQHVELTVCMLCRELAAPLTRHREEEASYAARLPAALAWPVTGDVWISLVAVIAFAFVCNFFGSPGARLASLGLYAASYAIIRMTAAGQEEFFVESSSVLDLIGPVLKSALVYVMLGAIALVYVWKVKPAGGGVLSYLLDPVLLGLALAAFIWGPMATLMTACHAPLGRMLNPVLVAAYIVKLGTDYWLALIVLFVLGVAGSVLGLVATAVLTPLPIPFLENALVSFLNAYVAFVSARALGMLLFVRGDRLGYGPESDYRTPILGATQPRGALAPRGEPGFGPALAAAPAPAAVATAALGNTATAAFGSTASAAFGSTASAAFGGAELAAPPPARSHAPIELADEPAGVEAALLELDERPRRAAPVELDAQALPSASDYFAKSVREAAERGDWPSALEAWKASPDPGGLGLSAEVLTSLGRAAAAGGDDAAARAALEAAIGAPGPELPRARARVFLARVLQERFGETAAARALLQEVVARAPGTDAAAFAQKVLGS